jgi:hypothetical protein
MAYTVQQLQNACLGKSGLAGGLNLPDIKAFLSEQNVTLGEGSLRSHFEAALCEKLRKPVTERSKKEVKTELKPELKPRTTESQSPLVEHHHPSVKQKYHSHPKRVVLPKWLQSVLVYGTWNTRKTGEHCVWLPLDWRKQAQSETWVYTFLGIVENISLTSDHSRDLLVLRKDSTFNKYAEQSLSTACGRTQIPTLLKLVQNPFMAEEKQTADTPKVPKASKQDANDTKWLAENHMVMSQYPTPGWFLAVLVRGTWNTRTATQERCVWLPTDWKPRHGSELWTSKFGRIETIKFGPKYARDQFVLNSAGILFYDQAMFFPIPGMVVNVPATFREQPPLPSFLEQEKPTPEHMKKIDEFMRTPQKLKNQDVEVPGWILYFLLFSTLTKNEGGEMSAWLPSDWRKWDKVNPYISQPMFGKVENFVLPSDESIDRVTFVDKGILFAKDIDKNRDAFVKLINAALSPTPPVVVKTPTSAPTDASVPASEK